MQILNLRRTGGAGSLVALFDLEATPEIKLLDWQLRRTHKGLRVYPPAPRGGRPAVLVGSHSLTQIGRLARAAFSEGNAPHELHFAA